MHVLKTINGLILDAVRRLRTAMRRRGKAGRKRKRKRGRKGRRAKAAATRRGPTLKEKASFVFRRRHLIVKRREKLSEAERDDLMRMREYLPELATLRRFADRVYWLFDTPKDRHQAGCRRAAVLRDPAFRAVPELAKAMVQLDAEKFPKLLAYLDGPAHRRVRTNNHVERTNRLFRLLEKVRYKWRRRRTLVRFVVLKLDEVWSRRSPSEAKQTKTPISTNAARRDPITDNHHGEPHEEPVEISEESRYLAWFLGSYLAFLTRPRRRPVQVPHTGALAEELLQRLVRVGDLQPRRRGNAGGHRLGALAVALLDQAAEVDAAPGGLAGAVEVVAEAGGVAGEPVEDVGSEFGG